MPAWAAATANSGPLTAAVPDFATTKAAATLAKRALSSGDQPRPAATPRTAAAVSPAPVTS